MRCPQEREPNGGWSAVTVATVLLARRDLPAVYAGGVAGAVLRALAGEAFPHEVGAFAWSTLLANVAGAALLGWVATRFPPETWQRPLLGSGFCGALTTFSTLQLELLRMPPATAVAYAAVTVLAGLAAVTVTR